MSTTVTQTVTAAAEPKINGEFIPVPTGVKTAPVSSGPLKLSGALDKFPSRTITPTIGSEFYNVDVVDWLHAPNADELIRDLAILTSERGFIVLRGQNKLNIPEQKLLGKRLGELTTRPSTSGLHIHPVNQKEFPDGTVDPYILSPTRQPRHKLTVTEGGYFKNTARNQSRADNWHTDGGFEHVPTDYTLLHMVQLPEGGSGGDTMFASSYEAYDLLSPPMAKFLESLRATFLPGGHKPENIIERMWKGPRGAPENVGPELCASHPCIRTNPVTGWKGLFSFGHHLEAFEGLGDVENRMLKEFVENIVTNNHQIQARVRWDQDDLIIWDNRSVYHSPTYDHGASRVARVGVRVCGVGEIPYFDPSSQSRRVALGI